MLNFCRSILCSVCIAVFLFTTVEGRKKPDRDTTQKVKSSPEQWFDERVRVHRVGNIGASITNRGIFGSYAGYWMESTGGCFMQDPTAEEHAPSFVFPIGSYYVEYLFTGALWIGAVVRGETLVTVGHDGWFSIAEMAPEAPLTEKSILTDSPNCHPPDTTNATSVQDIIAIYSDTSISQVNPDPFDGPHRPLNIKVSQKSMAWSTSGVNNFFIIEYTISNIGTNKLDSVYIGFYIDGDCGLPYIPEFGMDDIAGLKEYFISGEETTFVNTAWIADIDGGPEGVTWTSRSSRGLIGIKVLDTPNPNLQASFNWWSSAQDPQFDWGPWKISNRDRWQAATGETTFFAGNLGTPVGDKAKYFLMSNGERDYDQIYSCIDYSDSGWLPPRLICSFWDDGYDTRFLYSFGPFDINASDSLKFAVALIGVDSFHVDPYNYYWIESNQPDSFYQRLNFNVLAQTVLRVESLYKSGYCFSIPGDPTRNGKVSPADIVYLINFLFKEGPAPSPLCIGDTNADGKVEDNDIVYLINYYFKKSNPPQKNLTCCL